MIILSVDSPYTFPVLNGKTSLILFINSLSSRQTPDTITDVETKHKDAKESAQIHKDSKW